MTSAPKITLASGSAIRADILRGAGVPFEVARPDVDEARIKDQGLAAGDDLLTIAMKLAEAKCLEIAKATEGLVIGADQILEYEGRAYDKPRDMDEARRRFLEMEGAAHSLINAVVVARDGDIIWRNIEQPKLVLRSLTTDEIDDYLDAAGPEILKSVGAYQIESLGARLFEKIEGGHFTVLGLSLFPLLECLRREGALAF